MPKIADKADSDNWVNADREVKAWLRRYAASLSDVDREEVEMAALARWAEESKASPAMYARRALLTFRRKTATRSAALTRGRKPRGTQARVSSYKRAYAAEEEAALKVTTRRACKTWCTERGLRVPHLDARAELTFRAEFRAQALVRELWATMTELDYMARPTYQRLFSDENKGACLAWLAEWGPKHLWPALDDGPPDFKSSFRLHWLQRIPRAETLKGRQLARMWIAAGGWPARHAWPATPGEIIEVERKTWDAVLRSLPVSSCR